MKQFIKIPRVFLKETENTKFIDILVYAILDNQKDGNTSRIGMRTISEKYNITLLKVEESIKRLSLKGYVTIKQNPCVNTEYVFNEYSFPKSNEEGFLMLDPDVLSTSYKAKDRGILIYLQLCCLEGLNQIPLKKAEEVAEILFVDKRTAKKYIKFFLGNSELTISKCGYFTCHYLVKKETKQTIVII